MIVQQLEYQMEGFLQMVTPSLDYCFLLKNFPMLIMGFVSWIGFLRYSLEQLPSSHLEVAASYCVSG